MKNTTFRKKALLSSVAMLLVALVALGSATFAWFAANPNASATGISLKTTASTGLVIRTDSDATWSHAAKLYNGVSNPFDLTPVSQEQETAANFWTVDAAASDEFTHDADGAMTTASVGTYQAAGAVYSEKVYFRLSDGSAATENDVYLTNVTITKNASATMENAIRVAVADSTGELLATYALSTAGANGTLTTAAKTSGEFANLNVAGTTDLQVTTAALSASGTDLSNYVTVYVYLDGQDSACFSDNVGTVNAAEIISSIQLDFKLK